MMQTYFIEENRAYKIESSKAIWSTDKLNEIFHSCKLPLSDVDFIFETETNIILVEYKNSNIKEAIRPLDFNPSDDKKINTIVKKFYDSYIYLDGIQKNKPKIYIYILESPQCDEVIRKGLRNKIEKRLPFALQNTKEVKKILIEDFQILSIAEWNNHKVFGSFKISQNLDSKNTEQ